MITTAQVFTETATSYSLQRVEVLQQPKLGRGFFLMLINAQLVPPHLAVMANDRYYSLGVKGAEIALPPERFWRWMVQREKMVVFIELLPVLDVFDEEALKVAFASCQHLDGSNLTCLAPIRHFCASTYDFAATGVDFVFDLLRLVAAQKKLGRGFVYNNKIALGATGDLTLPKYSLEQVYHNILFQKKLQNAS